VTRQTATLPPSPATEIDRAPFTPESLANWANGLRYPFSQEEIIEWAKEGPKSPELHGASDDDDPDLVDKQAADNMRIFKRLLIIQKDSGYWISDIGGRRGGYLGPFTKSEIEAEIMQFVPRLAASKIVDMHYQAANGNQLKKSWKHFWIELSTRAKNVVANLAAQRSVFDPSSLVMLDAVTPRRLDIEPVRNEEIAAFLNVLPPRVTDWLSVALMLDQPTGALALVGRRGTGKQIIARLVASVYSPSATPIGADAVMTSSFNDGFTLSPVCFLDEGTDHRMSSKVFRSLIGNHVRTLKRKYLPAAVLLGCPRLVIGLNDISELEFDDKMNEESMKAVEDRFVIVEMPAQAAAFLESLPDGTVNSWFKSGAAANHMLWLEQNHKFEWGKRFLCQGATSRLHGTLVTQNAQDTLVALTHLLASPINEMIHTKKLIIGKGRMLVNATAFQRAYNDIIGEKVRMPPKPRMLIKDLQNVGHRIEFNHRKYYEIKTELLYGIAEEYQIADRQSLETRVNSDEYVTKGGLFKDVAPEAN
jgi:hypothetical protein